jgi:hypothetical protein
LGNFIEQFLCKNVEMRRLVMVMKEGKAKGKSGGYGFVFGIDHVSGVGRFVVRL